MEYHNMKKNVFSRKRKPSKKKWNKKIKKFQKTVSKNIEVPQKMKNNKRFIIHCKIKRELEKIPNILYIGRVYNYINTKSQKTKRNELGCTSGLCHISIFNPVGIFKGFHLLIKISNNQLTELKVLSNLHKRGYCIAICSNEQDGIQIIKYYLKNNIKKLNSLRFGSFKLGDITKYKKIYNHKFLLSKKRLGEYKLHSNCAKYIRDNYSDVVIDGQPQGNINHYYHWIGSFVGYPKGACDMFLWIPQGKYNGFAAEFKVGSNKLMKNQKEFIQKLKGLGWYICEPRSQEEMITQFSRYMDVTLHFMI